MNNYFKVSVVAITALALAGCVTTSTGTTISTDVANLVTDVGNIISISAVLSQAQIDAIKADVSNVCNFVPTTQTVLDIAGLFSNTVNTVNGDVTPVVTSICNQAKATSTTLSASRIDAHKIVTIGSVGGVAIKGYYTR